MILDIEHTFDNINISYFDKNGHVKLKKYKLKDEDLTNWTTCSSTDSKRSSEYLNWDGKSVKRVSAKRLNSWSIHEFIHNLPNSDYEEITAQNFPKIQSIDIETEVIDGFPNPKIAKERITIMAIATDDNVVTVLGWQPISKIVEKSIYDKLNAYLKNFGDWSFKYVAFNNEYEMLYALVNKLIPRFSLMIGWNFIEFDWAYITQRCLNLGIDIKKCSPTYAMPYKGDIPVHVGIVDYMQVYKRWDRTVQIKESNKLDFVAGAVLGVKKLEYSGTLQELYQNDYDKYILYCAVDAALVHLIHRKLKTLNSILSMACLANISINRASSPVSLTEALLWQEYYKDKKVVGDQKIEKEKGDFEGAFVKEPIPNMYNAVAAYDAASLYPSIMRQFNISPESFVKKSTKEEVLEPYRQNKDFIVAVNGAIYKADKVSALTNILTNLYTKRRFYKDKYLEIEQQLSKLKNKK